MQNYLELGAPEVASSIATIDLEGAGFVGECEIGETLTCTAQVCKIGETVGALITLPDNRTFFVGSGENWEVCTVVRAPRVVDVTYNGGEPA